MGMEVGFSCCPFLYLNLMNPIQKLEESLDGSSPLHLLEECFFNCLFASPMGIGLS